MTDETAASESTPLVVEVWGWGSDVKLRVQPEEGTEVRQLLDEAGVPYSTGAEFAEGPVIDLLVAVIETPEAWTALAGVIATYLGRNSLRSVRAGDIVIKGESRENSMRMIRELQATQDAQSKKNPAATTDEESSQD